MAMDVSRLGIEVVTSGIKEASDALGGLSRSAGNADKKVVKITESLGKLMSVSTGVQSGANGVASVMGLVANALAQTNANLNATTKALTQATSNMNSLTQATQQGSKAIEEKNKRSSVYVTTLKAMGTAAMAYIGINFVSGIIKQADSWAMLEARLKNATGSLHNAQVTQENLFDLAQKLRIPLEDAAKLYVRMAKPMAELGKTSKQTMTMVEGVGLALQLNGASAAEASSVMLQFSQSIAAGRLNGAELNAVLEGSRPLVEAIRDELNKTSKIKLNFGDIKELGAQGKLSVDLISRAIENAAPRWRKEFAELPITVDGAMTMVKNSWFKAMGELGKRTQFNTELAKAIMSVQPLIPVIRDELAGAFIAVMGWIERNKSAMGEIWEQAKGLAKDVWEIVSIFGFVAGAIVGAGNETSVFAALLWSVRLTLNFMLDAFTMIGGAILVAGGYITRALTSPLEAASGLLSLLLSGFASLAEKGAIAAKAVRNDGLANTLGGMTESLKSMSATLDEVSKTTAGAGDAMVEQGKKAIALAWGAQSYSAQFLANEKAALEVTKERGKYNENHGPAPEARGDDKAAAKARKEAEKHADALKDLNAKLEIQEEIQKRLHKYGLDAPEVSESTKERIKLEKELATATGKHAENLRELIAVAQKTEVMAALNEATKDRLKLEASETESIDKKIKAITEEAIATEYKVKTFGMLKGAMDELEIKQLKEMEDAYKRQGNMDVELAKVRELIAAKERLGKANTELGIKQGTEEAQKSLDKLLDSSKLANFGNDLKAAFGKGVQGISSMTSAFDKMNQRQRATNKAREDIIKDTKKDSVEQKNMLSQLADQEAKDRINAYGDMAGAAKEFFAEGTTGYKVMETAEKAFRAVEVAMAVESFLVKSGLLQSWLAVDTATKGTAQATDTAFTAGSIVRSGMRAAADGVAAVAKAIASLPFPFNIAAGAATAAALVAIGVKMSGGGSSAPNINISEQRQKMQGTGTVLGDESAKSQSLGNAIDRLARNADITLQYTSNMLMTLQAIRDGIQGMAKFVSRAAGIRGTAQDEMRFGVGEKPGGIFKSSKKTELLDSGIEVHGGQTVGGVTRRGSVSAEGYADVRTTKSNWWSGSKSKTKHHVSALEQDLLDQMGKTVTFFQKGIVDSVESLGGSGSQVKKMLEGMSLNIGKISLKGKTGEEVAAELEAIFSSLGDRMAKSAFKGLEGFEKNGEGYFETLVKVATGVEKATYSLDQMGISAIHYSQVVNKQGDVATEIVRQSLQASTSSGNIRKFLGEMNGSAEELMETYKKLVDVTESLKLTGIANDISRALIRGAGGLDSLQSHMSDFIGGMFTDEERQAMSMSKLRNEFAKLNIAMPNSKESFKALVKTLMAGGEASQEMAGKVLALSSVFVDAFDPVFEQLEQRVEDARSDLSEAYERESEALTTIQEKFLGFSESLKKFRDSLLTGDLSTLSVMEKYQTAAAKYQDTYARAMAGDEKAISDYESVASEFLKFSREMYSSSEAYTADFERVLRETEGLQGLTEAEADQATQSLNLLKDQVAHLISIDESTKTVAEALVALNEALAAAGVTPNAVNVSHIPEVIKEVAPPSIIPEKKRLSAGWWGVSGAKLATDLMDREKNKSQVLYDWVHGSHADGLDNVPFDGYVAELHKGERVLTAAENKSYQMNFSQYGRKSDEALVSEIRSLRQELAAIKEERREQTAAIIASNYDANERNAQSVVEGVKESAQDASYYERTKTGLV